MSASAATKKTIYLIRHAQSTHNEFALTWKQTDEWHDPMYVDAKLSKLGQSQVEQLREKAKQYVLEWIRKYQKKKIKKKIRNYFIKFSPFKR